MVTAYRASAKLIAEIEAAAARRATGRPKQDQTITELAPAPIVRGRLRCSPS